MNDLLSVLMSQMGGDTIGKISNMLGEDPQNTQSAIGSALPVLVNALAKNSSTGSGAIALQSALDRDHDGSILDNIGGFLQDPQQGNGAGILRHVLGDRRDVVENYLSQSSGIGKGAAGGLLEMLAPIVMGYLGRQIRGGAAPSGGGIGDLLNQFKGQVGQATGEKHQSFIENILDSNNDGSIVDDLTNIGGSLLGKFLRR